MYDWVCVCALVYQSYDGDEEKLFSPVFAILNKMTASIFHYNKYITFITLPICLSICLFVMNLIAFVSSSYP